MKNITTNPKSAALIDLLFIVPMIVLNQIVGNRIEPFFSLIRPGIHTSPSAGTARYSKGSARTEQKPSQKQINGDRDPQHRVLRTRQARYVDGSQHQASKILRPLKRTASRYGGLSLRCPNPYTFLRQRAYRFVKRSRRTTELTWGETGNTQRKINQAIFKEKLFRPHVQ